jgi:hypothetical protein
VFGADQSREPDRGVMYGVRVLRPGGEPEFVVANSTVLTEVPGAGVMVQLFGALIDTPRPRARAFDHGTEAGAREALRLVIRLSAQHGGDESFNDLLIIRDAARQLGVTL